MKIFFYSIAYSIGILIAGLISGEWEDKGLAIFSVLVFSLWMCLFKKWGHL